MKEQIESYFDRLWPINRSLTGDGNRETLKILSEIVDLEISEVPSGTTCFDWTVPPEWNCKEAWIKDTKGNIVVDFAVNNLHLVGYSIKFRGKLSFDELKEHLYTMPKQPTLIPYVTSYYKERWGFCMSQDQYDMLDQEDTYEVYIDSEHKADGSMTIGEAVIKGETDQEILLSTYICHPSMANNELSGPLVTAFLYNELKKKQNLRYTYRFVFVPETVGAIYFLSQRGEHLREKLIAGYVLSCIGDPGNFSYKRSRRGNSLPDRAAELVLSQTEEEYNLNDFIPNGSDERQYCSPGFNLPVGSILRTMYGKYKEYHTSGDNRDFISFEAMEKSVEKYVDVLEVIERNDKYINTVPFCEPQLGKRDLYPTLSVKGRTNNFLRVMMWVLNLSDGEYDLIDMSKRSGYPVKDFYPVLDKLMEKGILKRSEE